MVFVLLGLDVVVDQPSLAITTPTIVVPEDAPVLLFLQTFLNLVVLLERTQQLVALFRLEQTGDAVVELPAEKKHVLVQLCPTLHVR